jgi:hypothetical protein
MDGIFQEGENFDWPPMNADERRSKQSSSLRKPARKLILRLTLQTAKRIGHR